MLTFEQYMAVNMNEKKTLNEMFFVVSHHTPEILTHGDFTIIGGGLQVLICSPH